MQYYPRLDLPGGLENPGAGGGAQPGLAGSRRGDCRFTDDDCIPDPNWLTNGLSAFVDEVAAVSGRIIVPLSPDPTDHELNTTGLERSDFITANCFYRRSVLEQVGGFDERFSTAWRENSDLFFTVRERNYSLAWATGALVVHPVRPEAWGSSLRSQRKSFYNALLYKKHPELYQRYIQPAPPWNYYAILMGVLISAAGLMFNSPAAAILGALIWVSLTARFCWRRLSGTSHAPRHVAEMVIYLDLHSLPVHLLAPARRHPLEGILYIAFPKSDGSLDRVFRVCTQSLVLFANGRTPPNPSYPELAFSG